MLHWSQNFIQNKRCQIDANLFYTCQHNTKSLLTKIFIIISPKIPNQDLSIPQKVKMNQVSINTFAHLKCPILCIKVSKL